MATLTREQERVFAERLSSSRMGPSDQGFWRCPFCDKFNRYQTRLVYALQSYEYDAEKKTLVNTEGPVLPVIPLICQTCGYTHFFSAALHANELKDALGLK